jgi:hypothetical protein
VGVVLCVDRFAGGADIVDKSEFIAWLLSDAPVDTKVYGEKIQEDQHWVELIEKARSCMVDK